MKDIPNDYIVNVTLQYKIQAYDTDHAKILVEEILGFPLKDTDQVTVEYEIF